uniref:Uncharacterized protein n=1 Tax=Fundulus heteroclitus TaxID=8078 RepID=A0A3Q2NVL3_FUNHE
MAGLRSSRNKIVVGFCLTDVLPGLCCRCRSYEDCCGTRCCVRALSIQRLWYFW